MIIFPASTLQQLEFDKIQNILSGYCRMAASKTKSLNLRIHTKKECIEKDLRQTFEFKQILQSGFHFPNDYTNNIERQLKLLSIPGSALAAEDIVDIRKLTEAVSNIFRWFEKDRKENYPTLYNIISASAYEPKIKNIIDDVLDETGTVKDTASPELANIRMEIYRKRNELRRAFDKIAAKYNKLGYLADIEESFMNGRRVLAVVAENKRMIKGVLHGESDSRRTSYIEPEETIYLSNAVFSLEHEEGREIYKILKELTKTLSVFSPLLNTWLLFMAEYDFILAKAKFAIDIDGEMPLIKDKAQINLINAYHPLLRIYNRKAGKPTIPVNLKLDDTNRILVISGPNAGGKTVTLKTTGLLQIMMQSGLLVSVDADSEMGIFKQLFIHIGDTQSLEFELSTYSSQLKNMKHFIENANGKTLFFIDELGSGSDPNLGGAFAEVIMEELAKKHAIGIVTTHYLNLKIMANKVKGIINGAMQFDEQKLLPLYKLQTGKPGSSYTFSIAERIGLDKKLIERARKLADEEQFELDRLLNKTEQDLQRLQKEKKSLDKLLAENKKLKNSMEEALKKELHNQEMEKLKTQQKVSEEKTAYYKDMEKKLKSIIIEWRKAEDKESVIKSISALLFNKKDKIFVSKQQKKLQEKYQEIPGEIKEGDLVKMNKNRQVGTVKEVRGKKAIVQVGVMPITIAIYDLTLVKEKE